MCSVNPVHLMVSVHGNILVHAALIKYVRLHHVIISIALHNKLYYDDKRICNSDFTHVTTVSTVVDGYRLPC